jgi:hypothetical protein
MGANAQTSVPAFTAGQVLTAAQVTGINTGIPVFASSTERDAAFGGTGEKTLAEGQMAYLEDTNATQYYDGSSWASIAPTAGIAIFNETQSSGTSGGTFTAGSYVKRTLNTTVVNTITGASIATSVITLPAGTYEVHATAPAYDVDRHKMRIRDTTNSIDLAIGNPLIATSGTDVSNQSVVMGSFTLAGSTNIEVQHQCGTSRAGNGLGVEGSFGDNEVYAQITIRAL